MKQIDENVIVDITKIVEGGQGLGQLADGKKVFVWNALPGEKVGVRLTRQKHSYAEGIADTVIVKSTERIEPREANYLATSPWQILTFEAENRYKKNIVEDLLRHHKIEVPGIMGTTHDARQWHYRNKMEYSFWGDEAGLHLALHQRGSHGKQIVEGSALAMSAVDTAAVSVRDVLSSMGVRAGDLKTIIIRTSQESVTAGSLYVKVETFPELPCLPPTLKGLRVYYSNPKSPASVPTRLLYELGDCTLTDTLQGRLFTYDTDAFFQVNVPVFELALGRIKGLCQADELVDMYSGVGSIGLSVARRSVDLVELDSASSNMAQRNAFSDQLQSKVIQASTDKALEYIVHSKPVIFDPPRAGLHDKVVARVLYERPPQVVYLSCNPATQARDLAQFQEAYSVTYFEVFNFFPRTPHIEALAVLERK